MQQQTGSQQQTPPGWYPDPSRAHAFRWWDGSTWTAHVRNVDGSTGATQGTNAAAVSPSPAPQTTGQAPVQPPSGGAQTAQPLPASQPQQAAPQMPGNQTAVTHAAAPRRRAGILVIGGIVALLIAAVLLVAPINSFGFRGNFSALEALTEGAAEAVTGLLLAIAVLAIVGIGAIIVGLSGRR